VGALSRKGERGIRDTVNAMKCIKGGKKKENRGVREVRGDWSRRNRGLGGERGRRGGEGKGGSQEEGVGGGGEGGESGETAASLKVSRFKSPGGKFRH